MTTKKKWEKDDLLADLERSISKALEERMVDLAGALYRIQGSAKGWCDHSDCSCCPLAPMQCITNLENRVEQLIAEHHANQGKGTAEKPATGCQAVTWTQKPAAPMPDKMVRLYASRIRYRLGFEAAGFVKKRIRSLRPHACEVTLSDWQRISAAVRFRDKT
jgi:hypothetical protein